MPQQTGHHETAIKVGLIGAAAHTCIVLVVLLKVLSLDDGTAKWGISMALMWTLEIWTVPLYLLLDWDWSVRGFYLFALFGGGIVWFLVTYAGTRFVLKLKHSSHV